MRKRLMVGLASTALVAGVAAVPALAGESSAGAGGEAATESTAAVRVEDTLSEVRSYLLAHLMADGQAEVSHPDVPACGEAEAAARGGTATEGDVSASAGQAHADAAVDTGVSSDGTVQSTGGEVQTGTEAHAGADAAARGETQAESADTGVSVSGDAEAGLDLSVGLGG